ncbi:transcriptional regulator [Nocardiopsis sp. CNR-923]|uniref:ArsR/SmtB family transcription factor n=1 Tax=Nocardiopsis sp. CNR-923 TaxID=1904965 RepID=UPI00095C27A8|nr:metalloregulator ArsR/SmtB family transcription factor [Nocardiopsis sp. CNR-923]OLT26036.1 transcriptional regulator [Nocardiopsis sp. CNR-923]
MSDREPTSAPSLFHGQPPGPERLAVAADVFRLLSDPTRLCLLWTLARGEADVGQLTEACGASRTAVSQHLAKLRLAGLVEARRESRHSIYRMRDGHLRRLVLEALNHADHVVTGEPPHA